MYIITVRKYFIFVRKGDGKLIYRNGGIRGLTLWCYVQDGVGLRQKFDFLVFNEYLWVINVPLLLSVAN